MYQSFEAIVENGRIRSLTRNKIKKNARVLITVLDDEAMTLGDWKKLKRWIASEKKNKRVTSCHSLEDAKRHLDQLSQSR